MNFSETLKVDIDSMAAILGYGDTAPDEATARRMARAAKAVEETARPRWTYRYMDLAWQPGPVIEPGGMALPGRDIAAHLDSCHGCIVMALTLGIEVDSLVRAASIGDAGDGLLMDAAASTLAEGYADTAERLLRAEAGELDYFVTGRFSPGYGDLPLALQPGLLRLLDAARAIGLTVGESNIMLPRKSITALMGSADHPVTGRLAGCDTCALREGCERYKRGMPCGKMDA